MNNKSHVNINVFTPVHARNIITTFKFKGISDVELSKKLNLIFSIVLDKVQKKACNPSKKDKKALAKTINKLTTGLLSAITTLDQYGAITEELHNLKKFKFLYPEQYIPTTDLVKGLVDFKRKTEYFLLTSDHAKFIVPKKGNTSQQHVYTFIGYLKDIFQEYTGKKATCYINPYEEQIETPFFKFVCFCRKIASENPKFKKVFPKSKNYAFGTSVKRALKHYNTKSKPQ